MRSLLFSAVLAALTALAAAGPIKTFPGCYNSDTVRHYKLTRVGFKDFVKKNFVQSAFLQSKVNNMDHPLNKDLASKNCTLTFAKPIRACYNSVDPGKLGPPQRLGQYGFYVNYQWKCPGKAVPTIAYCKSRSNTKRANRYLNDHYWVPEPVSPWDWEDWCDVAPPKW